jgi:hypothetical protein
MANLFSVMAEYDYDGLIASEQVPTVMVGVTLAAAQGVLQRGTLLGIVTATGLAVLCDSTKSDGSQNPQCILYATNDTGTTGSTTDAPTTVPAVAYASGIFNPAAIITVVGQSIFNFTTALRQLGIFLHGTITNPTTPVKGVTIAPTTLTLSLAGTKTGQLTPTFIPAIPTNTNVTYSSSDPTKATVSFGGLVTGVAAGTTTITVTTQDGAYTATCAVTVTA